jgi:hypothetical protein
LKNNRTVFLLCLIFAFFLQTPSYAQGLEPVSQWTVGSTWSVKAVYRQVNGDWSDPILWTFTVEREEEGSIKIRVRDQGSSEALLSFDKDLGQLRHILLKDILRGEEVRRDIRIETLSPVYPLFSVVPFHFPFFSYNANDEEYRLKRLLNGRGVGLEILHQSVETATWEELIAEMPTEAKEGWETDSFVSSGRLFSVQKKNEMVFHQFWFPEYPWALYTEAKDLKIWMVR